MNLQDKLTELEKVFGQVDKIRQDAATKAQQATEEIVRLQGEYRGIKKLMDEEQKNAKDKGSDNAKKGSDAPEDKGSN